MIERTWPFFLDLSVAAGLLAGFYAILWVAKFWFSGAIPEVEIYRSPSHLPLYAFYSTVRIFVAYLLSLVFAIGYGYIAAYNRRVEALMIAILDILQSIPVLSFLPGVMLAMMSLFPSRQLGIELGAILLIFTGEVWNMAFSFYSSLKSIPRELQEACTINRFSALQRLFQLELPLRDHRPGVELDGLGGERLVLPDGLRDVSRGQPQFPPARAWAPICRPPLRTAITRP